MKNKLMSVVLFVLLFSSNLFAQNNFDSLTLNLKRIDDEFLETSNYYHKFTPTSKYTNFCALYISKQKNSKPELRLIINYTSNNWLFIEKFIFKADGKFYEYIAENLNSDNDNSRIFEWIDIKVNANQINELRKIFSSNDITLRYVGKQKFKDYKFDSMDIEIMNSMLNFWGKINKIE